MTYTQRLGIGVLIIAIMLTFVQGAVVKDRVAEKLRAGVHSPDRCQSSDAPDEEWVEYTHPDLHLSVCYPSTGFTPFTRRTSDSAGGFVCFYKNDLIEGARYGMPCSIKILTDELTPFRDLAAYVAEKSDAAVESFLGDRQIFILDDDEEGFVDGAAYYLAFKNRVVVILAVGQSQYASSTVSKMVTSLETW